MALTVNDLHSRGIEISPQSEALLRLQHDPSCYRIETTLGNLASHCLEVIANKPWAIGRQREVYDGLMQVLDPLVSSSAAHLARENKLMPEIRSESDLRQEVLLAPLQHHHAVQVTDAAKQLAAGMINDLYQKESAALREQVEGAIARITSRFPMNLISVCDGLRSELANSCLDVAALNPRHLCLEVACINGAEKLFGSYRDLGEDDDAVMTAIGKQLDASDLLKGDKEGGYLVQGLESILGISLRIANNDAINELNNDVDRGWIVKPRDLDTLVASVLSPLCSSER